MTRYRILAWRDIPTMIKVLPADGRPKSVALDEWFAKEVDRVAMREGLADSDSYLEQFHWSEDLESPGSPEEIVAEVEAKWLPTKRSA